MYIDLTILDVSYLRFLDWFYKWIRILKFGFHQSSYFEDLQTTGGFKILYNFFLILEYKIFDLK